MIDLFVKEQGKRHHVLLDHGPFPITKEEWEEAVNKFHKEWEGTTEQSRLMDAWVTTAREILKEYGLSDFDMIMLGSPLAMSVAGTAEISIKESI
jgi:hypothetical protein